MRGLRFAFHRLDPILPANGEHIAYIGPVAGQQKRLSYHARGGQEAGQFLGVTTALVPSGQAEHIQRRHRPRQPAGHQVRRQVGAAQQRQR